MSILIKGMEMPKNCCECRFLPGFECIVLHKDITEFSVSDNCPLVPVPPHGDLIERDALTISTAVPLSGKPYQYAHIDNIKSAPTIIPAEEDEPNMDEAMAEFAQYCESCEPTYDPETGAM